MRASFDSFPFEGVAHNFPKIPQSPPRYIRQLDLVSTKRGHVLESYDTFQMQREPPMIESSSANETRAKNSSDRPELSGPKITLPPVSSLLAGIGVTTPSLSHVSPQRESHIAQPAYGSDPPQGGLQLHSHRMRQAPFPNVSAPESEYLRIQEPPSAYYGPSDTGRRQSFDQVMEYDSRRPHYPGELYPSGRRTPTSTETRRMSSAFVGYQSNSQRSSPSFSHRKLPSLPQSTLQDRQHSRISPRVGESNPGNYTYENDRPGAHTYPQATGPYAPPSGQVPYHYEQPRQAHSFSGPSNNFSHQQSYSQTTNSTVYRHSNGALHTTTDRTPFTGPYNGPGYPMDGYNHASRVRLEAKRRRRGNLPKEITDKLYAWFYTNIHHPYPTEEQKQEIVRNTGLQLNQISNWFINARRRKLPQIRRSEREVQRRKAKSGPDGERLPNSSSPSLDMTSPPSTRKKKEFEDDDDDGSYYEEEEGMDRPSAMYNERESSSGKGNAGGQEEGGGGVMRRREEYPDMMGDVAGSGRQAGRIYPDMK